MRICSPASRSYKASQLASAASEASSRTEERTDKRPEETPADRLQNQSMIWWVTVQQTTLNWMYLPDSARIISVTSRQGPEGPARFAFYSPSVEREALVESRASLPDRMELHTVDAWPGAQSRSRSIDQKCTPARPCLAKLDTLSTSPSLKVSSMVSLPPIIRVISIWLKEHCNSHAG